MTHGEAMLALARTRIGEKYVNFLVPKNDPNWHGPWDCAEFMSWLVYQTGAVLYGCIDDAQDPATADAYTGAWQRDAGRKGTRIDAATAAATPGAMLLRYPPVPGTMGHIVLCDGTGGTVEAKGSRWGVCADKVSGRRWDIGVLIPGFSYPAATGFKLLGPAKLYRQGGTGMDPVTIRAIQRALARAGFDRGPGDGIFGGHTTRAVGAFQAVNRLVVDGEVGDRTARALHVGLHPRAAGRRETANA